jgi:hypothetical protein
MADRSEETARWQQPRPAFMRELEPLAHQEAWPSVDAGVRVPNEEQMANRKLFLEGRRRIGRSVDEVREQAKRKAG